MKRMGCLVLLWLVATAVACPGSGYAQGAAETAPGPRLRLSVGHWLGTGRWTFGGPTEAKADNGLWVVELRYRFAERAVLSLDYSWGSWRGIVFNGTPAPPTVGGDVRVWGVNVGTDVGSERLPVELLVGWQGYRAKAWDSAMPITDVAEAGGIRLGLGAELRLGGPWTLRAALAVAPMLSVTETVTNGSSSVAQYPGTMWDGRVAVTYRASPTVHMEVGWRGQRLELRRPADVVEHTLEGVYVLVRAALR